jgi:hypothetical protein
MSNNEGQCVEQPNAEARYRGLEMTDMTRLDPPASTLAEMARDLFPNVLSLPSAPQVPLFELHRAVIAPASMHPHHDRFADEVLADPAIGSLFEDVGEGSYARRAEQLAMTVLRPRYLTSGLMTLGGQLAILAGQLLCHASICCLLDDDLTETGFGERAASAYLDFRALLLGNTIRVPFLMGFVGIELAPGSHISTPWGVLRRLRDVENNVLPMGVPESGLVLVGQCELRAFAGAAVDELYRRHGAPTQDDIVLRGQKVALTASLAIEREPPIGPSVAWSTVFTLGNSGVSLTGARSGLVHPYVLSGADAARVEELSETIEDRYDARLDVAVRRCLVALGSRLDPVDSFLDGMIAIESLVGTDEPGLTFQLAAAMSLLLEDSAELRDALFLRMKRLYGRRSRIVHGSQAPSPAVGQEALEVVSLARRALGRIILERPELIASAARGREIVLGVES